MLATLEAKLITLGALVLLLIGAYAWAHHRGAVSQQAIDATLLAQKDQELAADRQSMANAATVLRNANAAVVTNQNAAAHAKFIADAEKQKAADAKQALDAANTAWQAKFKAAQGAKGCETLKEALCPAVMSY